MEPGKKAGGLGRPPPPDSRAASAARGDPYAYCGTCKVLLSIVTAARAKALPDRLAPVFSVMLE